MSQDVPPVSRCAGCGAEISPALLACPACKRLVHGDRLRELAQAAGAATDPAVALDTWQQALALLPRDSQQHRSITQKVADLNRQVEAAAAAVERARPGGMAASIASSLVFLLKGFFVPITFGTMLLSVAVYWTAMGWQFAVGFVISIYIHEMGHVAMLKRYGMAASPPIFIPALGALIRLKSNPTNPVQDARMGLAGPIWGLGSAVLSLVLWRATGLEYFAVLAKGVALMNLFNLLPLYPIDGGRAYKPMSSLQECIAGASLVAAWMATSWLTHKWTNLTALLAVGGVIRPFLSRGKADGDAVGTFQYVMLVAVLTAISLIPGPNLL